jgi:MFS family permease
VIVGADLLAGLCQALVAVLLITDVIELWQLVVLEALNGACFAFFLPASTGLVPQTVPVHLLQPANALLRLSINGLQIFGAGLGGLLVAAAGPGTALAVDAATFVLSAGCFALLRLPEAPVAGYERFLGQLRTGWREFRTRRWLWVIVAQFSIVNAAVGGAVFVLGPLIALRELGGAASWGLVLAAQSAGLLLGALLGLRFRPRRPLVAASLGVLLELPLLALLALAAPLPLLAAAAVVAGFGLEIFAVQWDTALQGHAPGDVLSRVSSYDALGSVVFVPLGLAVAGPLAAAVGTLTAIWMALALVAAATLAALAVVEVRDLPRADMA